MAADQSIEYYYFAYPTAIYNQNPLQNPGTSFSYALNSPNTYI